MESALPMLGLSGCLGALVMFVGDLVLYLPSNPQQRTASHYFESIDPGGDSLHLSSMQQISDSRLMLGGALGPIASALYCVGFLQLFFGLGGLTGRSPIPSVIASAGLSTMMIVAGVYHALFVYTGFLTKEIATSKDNDQSSLRRLLCKHRVYLRYIYRCMAMAAFVGSAAFAFLVLTTTETIYPRSMVLFTPVMSVPVKKMLKKYKFGGLVLCGGLTNLWNLLFFVFATACSTATTS